MSNYKRPVPAEANNVNYKDNMELRYLRWDYFVKSANPDPQQLAQKENIVKYVARRAYIKYRQEFSFMGFEIEDIESIARVHVVSYLDLYSMKKDADKRNRQISRFKNKQGRNPDKKDLEKRDNYSLISFLEQRLLETANILRQRSTGQAGFLFYCAYIREKGNSWPTDDELIERPAAFGWRKLTWSKFVKIKSRLQGATPGQLLKIEGKEYRIAVPTTSLIGIDDSESVENEGYCYSHNDLLQTPEDLAIDYQESKTKKFIINGISCDISLNERLSCLVDLYEKRTVEQKLKILLRFEKWLKRRKKMFNQQEFNEHLKCLKNMISSLKNSVRKIKNETNFPRDKRLGE